MNAAMDPALDYDAVIIGAGMSGLYQLYRLRTLGLRTRLLEAGTGVGGTWYWNRYPGARFDSESYSYGYSFSPELLQEWSWSEHFAAQPETLRYLNYVADKFDLRRDIQFRSRVTEAHYQADSGTWQVRVADGGRYRARFLITAVGLLSAPTMPRIDGVETFRGQAFHTAHWPHQPVQFRPQAGGGDWHRCDRRADDPGSGQDRRTADRVPAYAKLVRTLAQQPDRRSNPAPDQGWLSRDVCPLPANLRLLPAHARPTRHLRGLGRGARSLLREAVCRARLRHLARQLPRHPDGSGGERRHLRIRGAQDPRARQGPAGGRAADPERPRLRHPSRTARDPIL